MVGTLYLIPSVLAPDTADLVIPEEVRLRVQQLDYFLVEELRTARRFVKSICPEKVIEEQEFVQLNKDTPPEEIEKMMAPLLSGRNAGVISEAGCPGIADPGAEAVKLAHKYGITVMPLVGPSSILLALMGSGFSGQSFAFHGYLPIDRKPRTTAIKQLEKEMRAKDQTQIFMETPYRNNQLLADLLEQLAPDTKLCIAANLTGPDQLIRTRSIKEWQRQLVNLHKQPVIFLMYS